MENPIKMDDLGVPLFLETSISPVDVFNMFSTFVIHMDQISHGKKLCIQTDQLWLIMPLNTCPKILLEDSLSSHFPPFCLFILAQQLSRQNIRHPPSPPKNLLKLTPFLEMKKPLSGFEKVVDSLETFDLMQGDEVNSAGKGG